MDKIVNSREYFGAPKLEEPPVITPLGETREDFQGNSIGLNPHGTCVGRVP